MAISDSQKVDYLWKKLGYSAAKTDTNANKKAPNEATPSPLQIRADKLMASSGDIPTTIPGSNTSIVTTYTTSLPVECTEDITSTANRTWETGQTDWISPEFGSTYQVKVYIHTSNDAGNAASAGTQVFATGSGNDDEWFFDYQAGILHFIGDNLPNGVNFTGKSVYVSGAKYSGDFGVVANFSNITLGNLTISGDTITSTLTDGNIILEPTGQGTLQFTGNSAIWLPVGSDAERPINAQIGYLRYNVDRDSIEYYDGVDWDVPGDFTVVSDVLSVDGISNVFSLSTQTTTTGVLVSINGTLQQPGNAYTVSGNLITFTETPTITDVIEVRTIGAGGVSIESLGLLDSEIRPNGIDIVVTGNLIANSNVTYSLGSQSIQWKDAFVSNVYASGYSHGNILATHASISAITIADNISVNSNDNEVAIVNLGSDGVGNIGSIGNVFNIIHAIGSTAGAADLAEIYTSDVKYEPGTVVVFGGDKEVTESTQAYDGRVAGVVSEKPAYLMNDTVDGVAVALQGRVKCKLIGPVNKGDLVTTSDIPGTAMVLDKSKHILGCVIGKSLENHNDNTPKMVEVVVGRL